MPNSARTFTEEHYLQGFIHEGTPDATATVPLELALATHRTSAQQDTRLKPALFTQAALTVANASGSPQSSRASSGVSQALSQAGDDEVVSIEHVPPLLISAVARHSVATIISDFSFEKLGEHGITKKGVSGGAPPLAPGAPYDPTGDYPKPTGELRGRLYGVNVVVSGHHRSMSTCVAPSQAPARPSSSRPQIDHVSLTRPNPTDLAWRREGAKEFLRHTGATVVKTVTNNTLFVLVRFPHLTLLLPPP